MQLLGGQELLDRERGDRLAVLAPFFTRLRRGALRANEAALITHWVGERSERRVRIDQFQGLCIGMRKLTGALAAEATAEATKVGHGASLQADSLLLILRRVDRCGERCGSREGGGIRGESQ